MEGEMRKQLSVNIFRVLHMLLAVLLHMHTKHRSAVPIVVADTERSDWYQEYGGRVG